MTSLFSRTAIAATVHCLTGCAIGEVSGLLLGTYFGWSNLLTVIVAVSLAFVFGYALSLLPLVKAGFSVVEAGKLVFAADTLSITVMEIVDNGVMLAIPGAMDAHGSSPLMWIAMIIALAVAFVVATPVNGWLLARNKGHAITHGAMMGGAGNGEHAHHDHSGHHDHHEMTLFPPLTFALLAFMLGGLVSSMM